jgi:peroxiredoxin
VPLQGVFEGQPAPHFAVETVRGERVDLDALRGKVVLVDFWATWCGPCVEEIPTLRKAHSRHADEGLVIVGLSMDEDAPTMREFAKREEMQWPLAWLEGGQESDVARRYAVAGVPATFLVDRDGRVVGKDLRGRDLLRAIEDVLEAPVQEARSR